MHRVHSNRQRVVALRIVAYGVTLLLTVITTVVLLYVALGYRFDGSGHVKRTGLLLVSNRPEDAAVYINNELKDGATPSRFVLSAGTYNLKLARTDYHDWSKQVAVAASGVREVTYPLLIPTKLSSRQILELTTPSLVSQSQDKKLVLTHVTNAAQMQLIELDPQSPKQTTLALPSQVKRESGQYGTFAVIEWALNNKKVLLQQTLPSGAIELLSLDVTKPEEAIVVTSLYGADVPSDIHYVGGKTDVIYGVKDGILSRYSLEKKEMTRLLENVRSYQPYSDDTILFDRSAENANEIGILKDDQATVIARAVLTDAPALLRYARFEDTYYFVAASPSAGAITIYRDPLKKPILKNQLPLKKLDFAGATMLDFSDSSQFVMAQNGKELIVYNLDDLLSYRQTLPFEIASGSIISWADSAHLQAQDSEGSAHIFDYDGQNMQKLLGTRLGTKLLFANDFEHFYQVLDEANARTKLSTVSLVANKE